jgi:hypothetical protein
MKHLAAECDNKGKKKTGKGTKKGSMREKQREKRRRKIGSKKRRIIPS